MATGPQFREALAPVLGLHPATLERYFAEYRQAGMTRKSGKGGGVAAAHWDEHDGAVLLLGLASVSPGECAFAVKQLRGLRSSVGSTLFATLKSTIADAAATIQAGEVSYGPNDLNNWELALCLSPLKAYFKWTRNGLETKDYFKNSNDNNYLPIPGVAPALNGGFRRLTIIDLTVLNAVAELCADTLANNANKAPTPNPGSQGNLLETKKAAPGRAASIRNQDHHSIPGTDKPENRQVGQVPQALSSCDPGSPQKIYRRTFNGDLHSTSPPAG